MSIGLNYVNMDFARLGDSDASLKALQFEKLKFGTEARLKFVDIKDAAMFVEGMRHYTHLQGLVYV